MKKIKVLMPVFAIFVALVGMVSVFATSYNTTLEMGPGRSVTGALRYYSEGIPAMQFTVKYFVKYNNENYTRLRYKVIGENNRVYFDDSSFIPESAINANMLLQLPLKVSSGKYKWYYATKVDDRTYSGFYMNPVVLYTL